jgi:hypothetical protein
MRASALVATLMVTLALGACGDDDGPASIDAMEQCVGDTGCNGECELGNSIGVGRYCTAGGGECADTPNRAAPFCTADQSDEGFAFCTRTCANDEQCGENARCLSRDGSGPMGCVPAFCLGDDPDAGAADAGAADAGLDAGDDAAP